jgi:hypothetical protein
VKLTIIPHLGRRLRIYGTIPPLAHKPTWCTQGQITSNDDAAADEDDDDDDDDDNSIAFCRLTAYYLTIIIFLLSPART